MAKGQETKKRGRLKGLTMPTEKKGLKTKLDGGNFAKGGKSSTPGEQEKVYKGGESRSNRDYGVNFLSHRLSNYGPKDIENGALSAGREILEPRRQKARNAGGRRKV